MKSYTLFSISFMILYCTYTYTQQVTPADIDLTAVATLVFNENIPTQSMYEPLLEKIYGKSGLAIDNHDLTKIKQAYCYLEFLVKLEYVQKNQSPTIKQDFARYLSGAPHDQPYMPDNTLLNSQGWQAISLTQTDVSNSVTWQNIIKTFLCDNQASLARSVNDATNLQHLIFTYLPNIEAAYDTQEVKTYWLCFHTLELQKYLQQEFHTIYSKQFSNFKNLPIIEQIKNLEDFKTTEFYQFSHTQQTINASNQQPIKKPNSPIQEQIVCYFMFLYIQQLIIDFITIDNVYTVITQANTSELQTNFLPYNSNCALYLQELLHLQRAQEYNKNNVKSSSFTMNITPSDGSKKNSNLINPLSLVQSTPKTSTILQQELTQLDPQDKNFQQHQIALFVLSQMPIGSSFDDKLQQMYGPSGFNLPQDHIDHIKKIYTYLEFYAKLDKAKNDPKYATAAPDFANFLEPHADKSPRIPTQQLLQSNSWKSITIQEQDIISSPLWQNFLKMLLANNIDQTADFVTHNYAAQDQLFIYMPNIENAYSTQDFTALRLYQESLQHYEILQHIQRQYYINQCTDLFLADQNKVNTVINTFKTTEYYTSLNQTLDKNHPNIPQPDAVIIEQITAYFLITFLQKIIYQQLNTDNLEKILQQTQTVHLKAQIFFYTISDYIYVYNYLHLNNTIQANKQNPIQDTIYMKSLADTTDINKVQGNAKKFLQTQAIQQKFKTDGQKNLKANMIYIAIQNQFKRNMQDSTSHPNNNVVIQNIWNRIGDSFKRAGNEIKKVGNDIKDAGQTINNTIINPASQSINNTIINPAAQALTAENIKKGFDIAEHALTKSVAEGISIVSNTLADGFIEMSAKTTLLGCSIAQGLGAKVDPHAVADSVKRDLNRHRDIITGIIGAAFVVAASIIALSLLAFVVGPALPGLLVAGGNIIVFISEYQENSKFKHSFENYVTAPLMVGLMPILIGMEIMTDAFTTGLIETIVGITWFGCTILQAYGLNINPNLEAEKIRNKMEAVRSVLNIVNSIVISIIITAVIVVCTWGVGAAYAAALDAGLFGTQAAASAATATAAAAEASSTAAQASLVAARTAEAAAQSAYETALKGGTKQAAQAAAKQLARESAKRMTAEVVAKQAEELAAQTTVKAAARQAVAAGSKNLAAKQAEEFAAKKALEQSIKQGVSQAERQALEQSLAKATEERIASEQALNIAKKQTAEATKALNNLAAKQAVENASQKASSETFYDKINSYLTGQLKSGTQADVTAKQLNERIAQEALEKATKDGIDDATKAILEKSLAKATQERLAAEQMLTRAQATTEKQLQNLTQKQISQTEKQMSQVAKAKQQATAASVKEAQAKQALQVAIDENADQATIARLSKSAQQAAQERLAAEKTLATAQSNISKTSSEIIAEQTNSIEQSAANLATKQTEQQSAEKILQSTSQAEKSAIEKVQQTQTTLEEMITKENQALKTVEQAQAQADKAAILAADGNQDALAFAQEAQETLAKAVAEKNAATAEKLTAEKAVQLANQEQAQAITARENAELAAQKASQEVQQAKTALQKSQKPLENFQANKATAENNLAQNEELQLSKETSQDLAQKQHEYDAAIEKYNQAQTTEEMDTAKQAVIKANDDLNAFTAKIISNQAKLAESTTIFTATQQNQRLGQSWYKTLTDALDQGVLNWTFLIGQVANAGFSVFTALGALMQDLTALDQESKEEESIVSLWKFVENNKIATSQELQLFTSELHKKQQACIQNQAMSLHYYTNFLQASISAVQTQIAQALAQQRINLLTKDENGLIPADIGSLWGLSTPFVYLYPSQGFMTTTLGRPDFPYAQEVAQAPLTFTSASKTQNLLDHDQPQATKFWFNQRAVASLKNQSAHEPLDVEIKFRILYKLTSDFHIGLYLGGTYYDYTSDAYLQNLQDTGMIDLHEARLAKMFVIKQDTTQSQPHIGLYEHEGKSWIFDQALANINLDTATIYHMKAHLDQTTLTVTFWSEDKPQQQVTQTVSVTAGDQRTFGVICSGLALEWGVITPYLPITQNNAARAELNGQTEFDREKDSKAAWTELSSPKFGSYSLQSFGKPALIQKNYIYTTTQTQLKDPQGKNLEDILVFGYKDKNAITQIGISPINSDPRPNVAISLITDTIYDEKNNIVGTNQDTWSTLQNSLTTISSSLQKTIAARRKQYGQTTNQNSSTQDLLPEKMVTIKAPDTGGVQRGISDQAPAYISATPQSISKLQTQAAGDATIAINF